MSHAPILPGATLGVLGSGQLGRMFAQTAQAMGQRGPKARLVEFEGVGHAPTLVAADQVAAVQSFLLDAETKGPA